MVTGYQNLSQHVLGYSKAFFFIGNEAFEKTAVVIFITTFL